MSKIKKQAAFSLMLPDELLKALHLKAKEKDISAAEIVRRELRYGLGLSTDKSETENQQIIELERKVAEHTTQLSAHTEQLLALTYRLERVEAASDSTVKRTKSLKPTQLSTKAHSTVHGSGEAASIYPGWEAPANISYVFDRFQALNSDEARAAFADKWIGLSTQSIDMALVVCYRLLSIIKEKEMYKISHWMEGNKTYNSFKEYCETRLTKPLKKWLELESTYQLISELFPDLVETVLALDTQFDYSKRNLKDADLASSGNSQNIEKQVETQIISSVKNIQTTTLTSNDTQNQIDKRSSHTIEPDYKLNQEETPEPSNPRHEQVRQMTSIELCEFCGLTANQLSSYKRGGSLPKEVSVGGALYSIDYKKRNLWSIKPVQATVSRSEVSELPNTENSPDALQKRIQVSSSSSPVKQLSESALSRRLKVNLSTLRYKRLNMSVSEFADWTRTKDPQGIAWRYLQKVKRYHPLA